MVLNKTQKENDEIESKVKLNSMGLEENDITELTNNTKNDKNNENDDLIQPLKDSLDLLEEVDTEKADSKENLEGLKETKYSKFIKTIKEKPKFYQKNKIIESLQNKNSTKATPSSTKGSTYDQLLQKKYKRHQNQFSSSLPPKKQREKMNKYKCELCSKFYEAIGADESVCLDCSRHRTNLKVSPTPEGFYDLNL